MNSALSKGMSLDAVDRSRLGWWGLGAGLGAALLFVLYSFVGTFVFGVFLYYATRPIYRRIQRRIGQRSLAAAISLFALALPALALVFYALLVVAGEIDRRIEDGFDLGSYPGVDPEFLARITDPEFLLTGGLTEYLSAEDLGSLASSLGSAADTFAFLGVGLVHLFIIVALAFYLLRDDRRLSRWAMQRFGDDRGILAAYVRAVDRDFNSIFFGNILNAALTGAIGVLAYTLLNAIAPPGHSIPAAPLVGMLAGVASLVPVVGMKLVYFPVAAYMVGSAILAGETRTLWFAGVFVSTSFVVVDTIPDLVLRPYVSGRSLHVGAVMLAYTFGPLLFGWYGIFLMPMFLVFVVHFARLVLPELLAGRPVQPYAVDPSYLVDRAAVEGKDGAGIADGTAIADGAVIGETVDGGATDGGDRTAEFGGEATAPDDASASGDGGAAASESGRQEEIADAAEENGIEERGLDSGVRSGTGANPGSDG